jgi:sugar phosphate isomerase/epimerase
VTPPPLAPRVGIFQGRLVPSTNGELQCSPGSRWRDEFATAGTLGLAHIELLADRVPDPANPIWTAEGRAAIRTAASDAGLALVSLCTEEPLDTTIADGATALDLAVRLAPVATELSLAVVVVPMAEASELADGGWEPAAGSIRVLAERLHPTVVALELTLSAADSLAFLDLVAAPGVGLCYDVGNATAAGLDPTVEIPSLGAHVRHVHAKDKDVHGVNVRFGSGRVDFPGAFRALDDLGYAGAVTMEATRGEDPVVTAAEHRAFLVALDPADRSDP